VELLTRANQRAYLKANRRELVRDFDHDVEEVMKRTIRDWSRYFDYCPVYFFYDTSAEGVKEKAWSTVLLDSNRRLIGQPVLGADDTDFYIAYYGSPIPQPEIVKSNGPEFMGSSAVEHYGDDPTALFREVLLVCDHKFRLLPARMPRTNYIRNLRPPSLSRAEYKFLKQSLFYDAKRWDVDYIPCAYSYAATLRRYFR
jgi:hypothetical protein